MIVATFYRGRRSVAAKFRTTEIWARSVPAGSKPLLVSAKSISTERIYHKGWGSRSPHRMRETRIQLTIDSGADRA